MGAVAALLLLSGALVAIAWPLIRPELQPLRTDRGPASHLGVLEERKQAIYGAIRDLGLDVRTDKVTEDDYRQEVGKLKAEAVEVLAEIDRLRTTPPRGTAEIEAMVRAARQSSSAAVGPPAARFCTLCGQPAARGDRFCGGCGQPLGGL